MTITRQPHHPTADGPTVQLPRPAVLTPAHPSYYPTQPPYPTPAANPGYPPASGWGAPPPAGPFPPAGYPAALPPAPGPRNHATIAISAAAAVVVAIALITAMIVTRGGAGTARVSIPGVPATTAATAPVPAPDTVFTSAQLKGLFLTANEMASITGQMTTAAFADVRPQRAEFYNDEVSAQACIDVAYNGELSVYRGSGYRSVRSQFTVARVSKDEPQLWIFDQTVVAYPTAQAAETFVHNSAGRWQACQGTSWTHHLPATGTEPAADFTWTADTVTDTDGLLTAQTTQEDGDGWTCRRGLKAHGTLVIDLGICGHNLPESVVPQGIDAITTKAATL